MNLYEELELSKNCTFDEIKQQYRHLAGIHHPDKGGDAEKFKRIKLAYEVLSDPERRKTYNETNSTLPPVDVVRIEAIAQLSHIFFSLIAVVDLHQTNLIDEMKKEVKKLDDQNNRDINQCEIYIRNLNVAKEKLIHKEPNQENLILGFIEKHLDTREQGMKLFRHRKLLIEHVDMILDQYQYGFLELAGINIGSE